MKKGTQEGGREGGREEGKEKPQIPPAVDFPQVQLIVYIDTVLLKLLL